MLVIEKGHGGSLGLIKVLYEGKRKQLLVKSPMHKLNVGTRPLHGRLRATLRECFKR